MERSSSTTKILSAGSLILDLQRKRKSHHSTTAFAWRSPNLTSMRFHNPFTNCQPQPGAGHLPGALHTKKLIKNAVQILRRDAGPLVEHSDLHYFFSKA